MTVDNKVVEELMDYIKANYQLIQREFAVESNDPDQDYQIVNMNFGEVMMELMQYINHKRNHVTFLNLLDKYKTNRNMSDSELYGNAWIDRRHYFKIVNERLYHPTKKTVIALGMALRLDKEEMNALLTSCGYTLSYQSIFDLVIMFCIEKNLYNMFDINALLVELREDVLVKE
jgi:hypothetical protein